MLPVSKSPQAVFDNLTHHRFKSHTALPTSDNNFSSATDRKSIHTQTSIGHSSIFRRIDLARLSVLIKSLFRYIFSTFLHRGKFEHFRKEFLSTHKHRRLWLSDWASKHKISPGRQNEMNTGMRLEVIGRDISVNTAGTVEL